MAATKLWEEQARVFALFGRLRREGAAHVIARAYRASVIRARLRYIVFWNHQEKALAIQRMARGMLGRLAVRRLRAAQAEMQRLRHASAIVLQTQVRGLLARRGLERRRGERERLTSRRRMLKLMVMQKARPLFAYSPARFTYYYLAGSRAEQGVRRSRVVAAVRGAVSVHQA